MSNPSVTDASRHDAERIVRVWRSDSEWERYADLSEQWATQEFRQVLGITALLFGVFFTGAGVVSFFVDIGMKDDALFTATGLLVLVFGLVVLRRARAASRAADARLEEVLPFFTTPAAAAAYQAMLGDPSSDHARAEQFRRALTGLPVERQVQQPEHAALLVLGRAAAPASSPARPPAA